MQFNLKFSMDNDAFDATYEGAADGDEISQILLRLSERFTGDRVFVGNGGSLRDTNGNSVGHWDVVAD